MILATLQNNIAPQVSLNIVTSGRETSSTCSKMGSKAVISSAFLLAALLARCWTAVALESDADVGKGTCAPSDPKSECAGLISLAKGLGVNSWSKNTEWLSDKTYCKWHGVR